ncbi:MAG: hypothetical protein JWP97_4451 [Labilithrix sp.]|nr:hypothetical protein [Labilithrix sp.]
MNQTTAAQNTTKKLKAETDDLGAELRDRVEHVKDLVENVRDQAEVVFRDRPYLVPVAAGVVGLGLGLLLGSKLTRFIVFTAVGTLVSETLGTHAKRIAGEFLGEFQNRLGEASGTAAGNDANHPS